MMIFPFIAWSLPRLMAALAMLAISATAAAAGQAVDVENGSRVTLQLKAVPPREAFEQLARQSGMLLRPYPPNLWDSRDWPVVDLSLQDVSFWTAVRELCDRTELSLQRIGLERDLFLMRGANRPFANYPSAEQGPFLVVAQTLTRNHSVDLSRGRNFERRCDIRLVLYAEPRIAVVKGASRATILEAEDENGLKLPPINSGAADTLQTARTWMWTLNASIGLPETCGQRIARLKGDIRLQVQTQALAVEFEDVLNQKDVVRSAAGRRIILKEVRKAGTETYTVQVEIHRDPARPDEWNDIDLYATFRMEDAEGRSLTRRNPGRGAGGRGNLNLVMTFGQESWAGGAGEAAKLIWDMPLEIGEIRVPFEFVDLPLP
jgi:hypothetical protein